MTLLEATGLSWDSSLSQTFTKFLKRYIIILEWLQVTWISALLSGPLLGVEAYVWEFQKEQIDNGSISMSRIMLLYTNVIIWDDFDMVSYILTSLLSSSCSPSEDL